MPGHTKPDFGRRYRVRESLGEGSFGRVYRVHDRLLERDVALKAFKEGTLGIDIREMLREEFLVLARLRHPGVPQVHDVVVDRTEPFFTMEYLRGPDILTRFTPPAGEAHPDRVAGIIAAFLSILSALRYLHARGIIHGDLKPSNVLHREAPTAAAGGDEVVLVDFGLHLRAGRRHGISGTLNYLAPEQIREGTLSPQTDLFSLGVLLYEVLSGRNPFAGIDPRERAAGEMDHPPSLGEHVPGVDRGLEDVILRLLAPDVSLRYRDAEEAQRDLLLVGGWTEKRTAALLRRDFAFDPGRVGREGALHELREAARAVRETGEGRTVLVVAAPGLGATRLHKQIAAETLAGGGEAIATSLRGVRAAQVITDLLERLGSRAGGRSREEAEARRHLEEDLTALGAGEIASEEWGKRKRIVFERFLRWLQFVAAGAPDRDPEIGPFLWAVRDADRADPFASELLQSVCRRAASLPLLLLILGRRDPPWWEAFEPAPVLELAPLRVAEVRELLRANLPGIAGQAELARVLHQRTHGNLRALEHHVEDLVRREALCWSSGGWSADLARVAEIPVSFDAGETVVEQLDALPPATRELLSAAAALGETFDLEGLATTADLPQTETLARLQDVVPAGILDRLPAPDGSLRLRFASPGLAERCAALIPAAKHRAHRRAALREIERRIADGGAGLHGRAARLCEDLRRSADASSHHAAHGRELRGARDLEGALRAFRRAERMRRRAKAPVSAELLADLVDIAIALGRHGDALPHARLLVRHHGEEDVPTRSRNLLRLAIAEQRLGHRDAARRFDAVLALPEAAETLPDRVEATGRLAQLATGSGDFERGGELHARTVELAEGLEPRSPLVRALLRKGDFQAMRGDLDGAEACYEKARQLAEAPELRPMRPAVHLGLGQLLLDSSPTGAIRELERAVELAREHADVLVEGWAEYASGIACTDLAETRRARDHYRRAIAAFGPGNRWELARTEATLGNLARDLGEFRQAEEHYGRFKKLAAGMPDSHPSQRLHRLHRWRLRALQGEPGLLEEILAARENFPPEHARSHLSYLLLVARLETEAGNEEEARETAERVLHDSRKNRDGFFETEALLILGDVVARQGRVAEARRHLEQAARIAGLLGNEVLGGDVDLCRAEIAANHPEFGEDPRAMLDRAEEVFRRGGFRPRLERARNLRRRLQYEPSPARPTGAVKELETMYRASEIIRSSHNLTELLEKLLDSAIELMRAERGLIFLLEGPEQLELKVSRGADRDTARDAGEISRGILRRAIQDARPIYSMNAMTDERFQSNRSVLNYRIRSFICVPLLLPDRAIGTLYVDNRKLDSVFDEPDARFLMAYGGFAAAAVENARNEGRLRQSVKRLEVEAREAWHPGQIVGSSPAMRRVLDLARKVGPREATVLLRGESGTGKELIARLLHDLSPRKDAPFVAVNCAALPGPLVESELFGVARGAATDVVERPGKFEEANGGTIFLDEIGDLALEAQSKILRAVQERCVERVGSHRTVPLDIRMVAATHTDLEAAMLDGRFREDLYYRLNVVPITLPPLRERPEDVAALVRHYVDRFCTAQSKPTLGIRDDAMRSYTDYEWPGNVRELKNAVERGVLLSDGEWLPPLERSAGAARELVTSLEEAYARGLSERELKRIYAGYVYDRVRRSKSRACELLEIDFKTLRSRLD